ncbi:N-acetyl-gamma-glutamyl-phosphate reductase [Desulfohalotomaculum tongense]|uniref:N-acetyl-gamma-glutamyl-phosphate reductase n=1 Tax=Desulforadius tongensis TaxID=1216062 RepID=UPI001957D7BE|nr:N-acetyl-gamma-glutamyl-phosphate reductase [Desulforadius tongensis]MBM7853870.1 N-acetyl-gamma-glutamyl-phosphate reductase [Desulforadius tongensis]
MIKAAVVGATGYTGAELVRILSRHPGVELVALTSRSYAGKPYYQVYPHLYNYIELECEELNLEQLVAGADVIFTALPHGHSMDIAAQAVKQGKKLVDLGADFRLNSVEHYHNWYKVKHTAPELLSQAVYGLPEINRAAVAGSTLVANPGCYPTTVILGLAPLLKNNLIDAGTIIIDSKSGVSGAGRGLSLKTHFSEVNDNFQAYAVAAHRHIPEMEQELCKLAGGEVTISFTPHLVPMTRGMLSTIYANLTCQMDSEQINRLYRQYYAGEYFVRVLPPGMLPQTKALAGSNFCDIAVTVDRRTGRVIVLSAIDNLVKGASGQAVQNMNVMFGLDEKSGLDVVGMYP